MLNDLFAWAAEDYPDPECLVLKRYREVIKIPYRSIYSIETVKHMQKLMITYKNGVYIGVRLLTEIQPKLDERFQRINRYAIVNMEHVSRKAYGTFTLSSEAIFRYSKRYITKEVLEKWNLWPT